MNIFRILSMAFKNTFRSKVRTFLTATAIFIGAFTLMLTNGIGTGINSYIDTQLDSIGGQNVMDVRGGTTEEMKEAMGDGLKEYDPDKKSSQLGGSGFNLKTLNNKDIETIKGIEGVQTVRPVYLVSAQYVTAGDKKYEMNINVSLPGGNLDYMAGAGIQNDKGRELVLTEEYLEPLGFKNAEEAINKKIEIGVPNALGKTTKIDGTIVGVQKPTLIDLGINTSEQLRQDIYEINREGGPEEIEESYLQAQITYDTSLGEEHVADIKQALEAKGYNGATVTDQIGMFKTIIDIIVSVLNGFAVIALIAAGFGIINTLLMSVQERTREIGLMKAMGLSSGKVFGLFTGEALTIGLLGSAMGVGAGYVVGNLVNIIARDNLSALGGIDVVLYTWPTVGTIVGIVLLIAFVAGTLPAVKAAKQNPIDALRYE